LYGFSSSRDEFKGCRDGEESRKMAGVLEIRELADCPEGMAERVGFEQALVLRL